jgi:hypothetical protein
MMDAKQAKQNVAALDRIRGQVVILRDVEEGAVMKGDLEDLLLPIDRLRRTMLMRGDALAERVAEECGGQQRGTVQSDEFFVGLPTGSPIRRPC